MAEINFIHDYLLTNYKAKNEGYICASVLASINYILTMKK